MTNTPRAALEFLIVGGAEGSISEYDGPVLLTSPRLCIELCRIPYKENHSILMETFVREVPVCLGAELFS